MQKGDDAVHGGDQEVVVGEGDDAVEEGDGDFVFPEEGAVVGAEAEEVALVGRDEEQLAVGAAGAGGGADLIAEAGADLPAL